MQNKLTLPIGVFDSGIGGLNVLKKLTELLPNENYIYLGDNANAPYGNKEYNELKNLVFLSLDKLVKVNVKAIVVACNTASTVLYSEIYKRYNMPFVFTLPPTGFKNTVLICTPNTANSSYVKNNFKGNVVPLPMLASEIENHIFQSNKINLEYDLKALPDSFNTLILGCTHYAYLKEEIKKKVRAEVVDSADFVAENLLKVLKNQNMLNNSGSGNIEFIGDFLEYNRLVYQKVLLKNGF